MPLSSRPIFVLSAPRSGSTLLRLILDAHPNIGMAPPAWLYELVYPHLYSYGDLESLDNLESLAEDILKCPFIEQWPLQLSSSELIAASHERSFAGLYDALHRLYADRDAKPRWGEKNPRCSFWVDEIKADFPDAQFVHLIRDGRDMALDIAVSPEMAPSNPYSGAKIWLDFNRAIMESATRLDQDSYYQLRYEDLCAQPEPALRSLCAFLQEDFDPVLLAHHETSSARAWAQHPNHQKTGRPITTEYCGMYRRQLRAKDRAALNHLIGGLLYEFGYPLDDEAQPPPQRLAWQLLEADMVTAPFVLPYRRWQDERRQARKERGVWREEERESLLRV